MVPGFLGETEPEAFATFDLDFAIATGSELEGYACLETLLNQHDFYFTSRRFIRTLRNKKQIAIDFLTEGPLHTCVQFENRVFSCFPGINRAVQTAHQRPIHGLNLQSVNVSFDFRICSPGPYSVLKLSAFYSRKNGKDISDWICICDSSHSPQIVAQSFAKEAHYRNPGFHTALACLRQYFRHPNDLGPKTFADFRYDPLRFDQNAARAFALAQLFLAAVRIDLGT